MGVHGAVKSFVALSASKSTPYGKSADHAITSTSSSRPFFSRNAFTGPHRRSRNASTPTIVKWGTPSTAHTCVAGILRSRTYSFATRHDVGESPFTTTTVVSGPPPALAAGASPTRRRVEKATRGPTSRGRRTERLYRPPRGLRGGGTECPSAPRSGRQLRQSRRHGRPSRRAAAGQAREPLKRTCGSPVR